MSSNETPTDENLKTLSDLIVSSVYESIEDAARAFVKDEEQRAALIEEFGAKKHELLVEAYERKEKAQENRHPDEAWYPWPCRSCNSRFSIRDYKYYLMTDQRQRGWIEAVSSFVNPLNLASMCLSAIKGIGSEISGRKRKDSTQAVCAKCQKFYSRCPYCGFMNDTIGKISLEYTSHKCAVCSRVFDVVIYNDGAWMSQ